MIAIQENILLAPYTTFKIGGPARYFFQASNIEEVREALCWAHKNKQKTYILGGGSNVLISDSGYSGLILRLSEIPPIVDGTLMRIFSGCPLLEVVETAQKNGLAGIERLAGVPGTLGGAIFGNAGAFGTEIKDVITHVTVLHSNTLKEKKFSQKECGFGYRQSYFKQNPEWIIIQAEISLTKGDTSHLLTIMEDTLAKRESKQTQNIQSAGSYFSNPLIEDSQLRQEFETESKSQSREKRVPAGWLIDKAGLRGKRIGDAMVSEEHPNYILNVGQATSENVVMLESIIKQTVRDKYNVQLEREVCYIGFS